ncbi:type IV pilus assembly protein PilM [Candidatus Parcubacteria bacterium]|nr:type IV pilus assembly protein PilM [Patescibacteria group bacterium]MCG2686544.1 type IV pilus assembly protein PilM [Candidatus Parcubacteria bacterium]
MFFSTQIQTFGLDISSQSIKVAQIVKNRAGLQLNSLNKTTLPDGILIDGEIQNEEQLVKYIKKTINDCQPKIKNNYVVTCLPEVKTFIKLIKIKLTDNKKLNQENIQQLIKTYLPKHVPMPIEEIYFDWQIVNQKDDHIDVLIGVAPKNTILSFSELIKKCGLIPVAFEIEAGSIVRAIFTKDNHFSNAPKSTQTKNPQEKQRNSQNTVYFIIDCGASRSGLIAWADGTIKFTTSLKTSGVYLTNKISKDLKLETKKAEKLKNIYGMGNKSGKAKIKKSLYPIIVELAQEIIKAKEFYEKNFDKNKKNYEIVLSGGSANLKGIDQELTKLLNMRVNLSNPLINLAKKQKIKTNTQEIQSYATAIGLSLRSFLVKDF